MSSPYVLGCTCTKQHHRRALQANVSDGWNTDPFKLTFDKETGKMFGRGSTDDKGPIMGWLNVLEAHHTLGLELPVNLRFCFEGMEESGSEGLDDFIASEARKGEQGWFGGVDCVCIVGVSFSPPWPPRA